MKIAVPTENELLSPHFGHCEQFYIATLENDKILKEEFLSPPPHEDGSFPNWLANEGVNTVIAGGLGQRAIAIFNQLGIDVYTGAEVKHPSILVKELLENTLKTTGEYCSGGHSEGCGKH